MHPLFRNYEKVLGNLRGHFQFGPILNKIESQSKTAGRYNQIIKAMFVKTMSFFLKQSHACQDHDFKINLIQFDPF